MEIEYLLLEESIDFEHSKSSEEQKNRIYAFIEMCEEINQYEEEHILYSTDIFDQSINGISFADWLYNEEEIFVDEKRLLQILFHKDFKNDEEKYPYFKEKLYDKYYIEKNLASIIIFSDNKDLAPIVDSVFLREDCFKVRRLFLQRTRDRIEFVKTVSKVFPNLYLGEAVENSIRHYNPIGDHIDEIIKHLSALNDHAVKLFESFSKEGEAKILDLLSSTARIICSPEGNPKNVDKYLTFNFKDTYGNIHQIRCSPHTKLYRADTDYRIYFTWNNGQIKDLPQILIGHIGGHPY
ncbi:hypothetical protein CN481_14220 [Bacillus sp. AFS006103]|nr:hypothetical protein CN481_14220 [Bacillus sp. AFS006103]